MDGAPDQVVRNSASMIEVKKLVIDFQVIKPEQYNENPAVRTIREIWHKWFQIMFRNKVPKDF